MEFHKLENVDLAKEIDKSVHLEKGTKCRNHVRYHLKTACIHFQSCSELFHGLFVTCCALNYIFEDVITHAVKSREQLGRPKQLCRERCAHKLAECSNLGQG